MRISDWSSDVCSSDLDSARDFGVRRCGDHLRDRAPHPSACSNQSDARHGLAPFVLSCLMTPMDDIRNIVILTGAGISAESGLATFRGPDGLWEGHRVAAVCTPEAIARAPALVQTFYEMRREIGRAWWRGSRGK